MANSPAYREEEETSGGDLNELFNATRELERAKIEEECAKDAHRQGDGQSNGTQEVPRKVSGVMPKAG